MAEDDTKRNGSGMEEYTMTPGLQQPQTVPGHMPQTHDLLVLAALMPGLEPADIARTIRGNHLTMCGTYRGLLHHKPEILLAEWTVCPTTGK
jgi:hypothetical protein